MNLLNITIPDFCHYEQKYVLEVILRDFLGLEFEVQIAQDEFITLSMKDANRKLQINSDFFIRANSHWLKSESMPIVPLKIWDTSLDGIDANLVSSSIPVIYGEPSLVKNNNCWTLGLDVFGSSFFMLSRYEELITKDRDNHNRFSASDSVAFKEDFLNRPVINEYVEILWYCLSQLFPSLSRNQRMYRKLISCDVDHPFDNVASSIKKITLRVGARILRDKNIKLAFLDGLNYFLRKFGSCHFDQYRKNIDWLMQVNEKVGNKVSFFFIPIQTHKTREDNNDVRHKEISKILRHIVDSGHYVGIHPGYNTYNDAVNFYESTEALKQALKYQGIKFKGIGGRQHYLMYDIAQTPQLWQKNGLSYDSTLGYADKAGFRCGICYEYRMYDLINRRAMNLMQRPLVAMDCTIIDQAYENLGFSKLAQDRFNYLKVICKQFNGDFTLLWHNSYFHSPKAKKFYEIVIQ